jgi:hypothetical protein
MRGITKAALVLAVLSAGVSGAQAADGDHKVLLCHATSSESNPYELISVDLHGADGHMRAGHGDGDHTDFLLEDGRSDCSGGPGGGEL